MSREMNEVISVFPNAGISVVPAKTRRHTPHQPDPSVDADVQKLITIKSNIKSAQWNSIAGRKFAADWLRVARKDKGPEGRMLTAYHALNGFPTTHPFSEVAGTFWALAARRLRIEKKAEALSLITRHMSTSHGSVLYHAIARVAAQFPDDEKKGLYPTASDRVQRGLCEDDLAPAQETDGEEEAASAARAKRGPNDNARMPRAKPQAG